MGYLSCKTHSSVSVSVSVSNSNSNSNSNSQPKTTTTTTTTRKTSSKKKKPHEHDRAPPNPGIEQFHYRDLELATDHFSDQKLLGRGSHGLVYKALLPSGRLVAVKKPCLRRPPSSPHSEFDNELLILSHLRNPRFVNLLGYSSDRRLIVVEYMSNGTLYDVLHKSPKPPNWGRRIRFALQTANAIETLHSQFPPVIHRDIKSANVLIDRNSDARLGDFGLALRCYGDDVKLRSTPPAGTIGYLDPGYVTPDNLSTKTDVFSFGILLLEILSGRKAIDVAHSPPSIVDWAMPLIRKGRLMEIYDPRIPPPKYPMVRKQLGVIAAKCVRSCRERRPSMKEVVEGLDGLAKLLPLHSWNGFVNPCLMVDAGAPLESGFRVRGFECGNPDDVESNIARDSKRVYSDLGFRNNLKDLMDGPEEDEAQSQAPKPASCGSSFRIPRDRFVGRERKQSGVMTPASVLQCRRILCEKVSSQTATT